MKLEYVIRNFVGHWPEKATYAYQSAVDSEIYFKSNHHDIVHSVRVGVKADKRGHKNEVTKDHYTAIFGNEFRAPTFSLDAPNPVFPTKEAERNRAIQRIENGLRKDFDIDSPEFAKLMFDKGWRK